VWDPKIRSKLTATQRAECCVSATKEFRDKVSRDLLPFIRQFQPDIVFISAGFDAHHDDMYHFLDEEDFYWLSMELSTIAYERGTRFHIPL
jgi:acetoin utilization deacetylase AcuC-like enzyme